MLFKMLQMTAIALAIVACTGDAKKSSGDVNANAAITRDAAGGPNAGGTAGTETGAGLYGIYCASCHGVISKSDRIGRDFKAIKASIQTVKVMNQLTLLSDAQLQLIADSLKAPAAAVLQAQSVSLSGTELYATNCASCHNELSKSSIRGKSAAQIANAIKSVQNMSHLSWLAAPAMNAIASVLESKTGSAEIGGAFSTFLVETGSDLYAMKCSACHGELSVSSKRGRSTSEISAALSAQISMRGIQVTSTQLELITNALANSSTVFELTKSVALLYDREQVATRLEKVFTDGVTDVQKAEINSYLDYDIRIRPEIFGGNCSRVDTTCGNENTLDTYTSAAINPLPNVLRAGRLYRACLRIASRDYAINALVAAVSGNTLVSPTATQIGALPGVIGLLYTPNADAKAKLMTLAADANSQGLSTMTQWRLLTVAVCSSLVSEAL